MFDPNSTLENLLQLETTSFFKNEKVTLNLLKNEMINESWFDFQTVISNT